MTTYSTGNPIGSTAVQDLYDNAENLDIALHTPETTWVDRLGKTRRSWAGSTGYDLLGDYEAGITVTSFNQIIRGPDGEFWRAAAGTALPYVTTGAGLPEGGAFVSIGDAALRHDLADPDQGASLISAPVRGQAYPEESLAHFVNNSIQEFRVENYFLESDGDDYGPAIRRAFQEAGDAGCGTVVFPPKTIYVRSLGDNPDYV